VVSCAGCAHGLERIGKCVQPRGTGFEKLGIGRGILHGLKLGQQSRYLRCYIQVVEGADVAQIQIQNRAISILSHFVVVTHFVPALHLEQEVEATVLRAAEGLRE